MHSLFWSAPCNSPLLTPTLPMTLPPTPIYGNAEIRSTLLLSLLMSFLVFLATLVTLILSMHLCNSKTKRLAMDYLTCIPVSLSSQFQFFVGTRSNKPSNNNFLWSPNDDTSSISPVTSNRLVSSAATLPFWLETDGLTLTTPLAMPAMKPIYIAPVSSVSFRNGVCIAILICFAILLDIASTHFEFRLTQVAEENISHILGTADSVYRKFHITEEFLGSRMHWLAWHLGVSAQEHAIAICLITSASFLLAGGFIDYMRPSQDVVQCSPQCIVCLTPDKLCKIPCKKRSVPLTDIRAVEPTSITESHSTQDAYELAITDHSVTPMAIASTQLIEADTERVISTTISDPTLILSSSTVDNIPAYDPKATEEFSRSLSLPGTIVLTPSVTDALNRLAEEDIISDDVSYPDVHVHYTEDIFFDVPDSPSMTLVFASTPVFGSTETVEDPFESLPPVLISPAVDPNGLDLSSRFPSSPTSKWTSDLNAALFPSASASTSGSTPSSVFSPVATPSCVVLPACIPILCPRASSSTFSAPSLPHKDVVLDNDSKPDIVLKKNRRSGKRRTSQRHILALSEGA